MRLKAGRDPTFEEGGAILLKNMMLRWLDRKMLREIFHSWESQESGLSFKTEIGSFPIRR